MSIQKAIDQMYKWDLIYLQQLGVWNDAIGGILRPDPDKTGYGDCSSTIQHAFLKNGLPNPGYYTLDMLARGSWVADSVTGGLSKITPGDIIVMQWPWGTWHVELAVNNTTCIGHGGPGRGPYAKNIRSYLSQMKYWEVRRHAVPTNNNSNTTATTTPNGETEEDNMKVAYYKSGNKWTYLVFNEVSGFYSEYSAGPSGKMPAAYNNAIARNWNTGTYVEITASHAGALKKSLDLVRKGV